MVEHKGEIKMIKIYKVDSFEKFEHLLNALHEQGAKWVDGCILDDKKAIAKIWNKFNLLEGAYKGVAIYNENGTIIFSTPPFIHYMIKLYEKEGKEYIIIEDVKLPKPKEKPKESETQQVQTHQPNVIQPGHYNQGDMDLFEIFYHQYPFNEFRTGMRMIAARYYHRYPDKNGLEDYNKGDEVMRRLREYEEREANE